MYPPQEPVEPEHQELLEHWICVECFETISADRPPIFNSKNCSCAQAGGNGCDFEPAVQALDLDQLSLEPRPVLGTPALTEHSDAISVSIGSVKPCEESNDRHSRDDYWRAFIHSAGLAGTHDGQRGSADTQKPELPYSLLRYVNTLDKLERSYHFNEDVDRANQFMRNDAGAPVMTSSMKVNMKSSQAGSDPMINVLADPLLWNGAWVDGSVTDAYAAGGWSLMIDDDVEAEDECII